MTALHETIGRRRRTLYVPAPGESVQQAPQAADQLGLRPSDPPIYRAMMRAWAGGGKTLPGRRDPEWARLAAPTVRTGQFGSTTPFSAHPMQPSPNGQEAYFGGEARVALPTRLED
ncbi:hypothetical protein [Streptomyces luteolus]|uniref:Uncharacterized protein n=1 Tax=Streptomyces luteolus TaxID=3043615 RepID=A0ABT6T5Q1_9ACTN|nr:hypothetical protein [Streptomyces sp. B-S-A12]MDI3423201.1 hypothetical protein [Streptomyces sp. B-S-A12]